MNTKHLCVCLSVLLLGGCTVATRARTGPLTTESFAVDRDQSESLRVDLNMKAGELRVAGGAAKFLEGAATYNTDVGKPVVRYSTAAGRGNLTVEQPGPSVAIRDAKYEWDVRLSNDVAVDLGMDFGAGEANLNAAGMSLRTVEVRMGAGRVELDFRGHSPRRSCDVRVRGGVGEAVIRLSNEVGIYAQATGGLGSIKVTGLRQEGGHWVNDAYDSEKPTIRVDVQGGIGEIEIIAN